MSRPDEQLLALIDKFQDVPICVVGDLIVDHYIWGTVNRISPEAPVVVVQVSEESKRPGGAANVAHNLMSLGARVSLIGVVGDDDPARELLTMLEDGGADTEGIIIARGRPTTMKTRVIAHAQQVVRVDRELTEPLSPALQEGIAARFQSKLQETKGAILSDYAKGAICPPVFAKVEEGYASGLLGAGKVPVLVDPKQENFNLYSRATVVKPNRKEAQEATSIVIKKRSDAVAAARQLFSRWNAEMILVTLGEMGMVLVSQLQDGEPEIEIDTLAREVFDVSGAGDTVSAVFMLGLAAGGTPRQSAMLANYAAGVVVGEIGTVAIKRDELRDAVASGGR